MLEKHNELHLARSLITNPDLLLLDEPLSNVDQSFKEEIQEKLKKILKIKNYYNNCNS